MCRAVLESEAGQTTAKGVNDGIVYLMVIPYILIGGLALFLYRYMRKILAIPRIKSSLNDKFYDF